MTDPNPVDTETRERGRAPDGTVLFSDRRLFMQLHVFEGVRDPQELVEDSREAGFDAVLYQHVADPWCVGLLTMHTDIDWFVTVQQPWVRSSRFADAHLNREMSLIGRGYAIGYEDDLERVLVDRNRERVLNPDWPFAVWYPLRRNGAFSRLEHREKMKILGEHGTIGRAYGEKDLGHDIRLACFGMDRNDNDFVVGLVGKDLLPLSKIVEHMRGTVQTSTYIEDLGPFFVGRAIYQSAS